MDFIVNGLVNARLIRVLSAVEGFSGECLMLEADTSLGSGRMLRELDSVDRSARPAG